MSSGEKPILGFGDLRRARAFLIIVPNVIDATAPGVSDRRVIMQQSLRPPRPSIDKGLTGSSPHLIVN